MELILNFVTLQPLKLLLGLNMKIMICIPFYMEWERARQGCEELSLNTEHEFVIEPRQGTQTYRTRNSFMTERKSSKRFQKPLGDYDYFMFIDSDIGFHADDVLKLIEHDLDVVGAPYEAQADNVLEVGVFDPRVKGKIGGKYKMESTGLLRVDWIGSGFVLIKSSVFERVEYPWFRHTMVIDGDRQEESGEDVGFCLNFALHNIPIHCDFSIKLKHTIRHVSDFEWFGDIKGEAKDEREKTTV